MSDIPYCLVLCGLLLLAGIAGAAPPAPVPGFYGENIIGPAPREVDFIDTSEPVPAGWTWFFGDEEYKEPWTLLNGSAGWDERDGHTGMMMPSGVLVLTGGYDYDDHYFNDTWQSTDYGRVWLRVNASCGWEARYGHSTVVMPDGSIVLTGGRGSSTTFYNDTWRSTDNGRTWARMNATSAWTARYHHSTVALPDGSIVLAGGGRQSVGDKRDDVWRSTDNGVTWARVNASAWSFARQGLSMVVTPDSSIVVTGGNSRNETWKSTDKGVTWSLVNASSGWPARAGHSSVVMPDGSIILMGGEDYSGGPVNDTWRSTDSGATWTQVNKSPGWAGRFGQVSLVIPDGSMLLMGGYLTAGERTNDVWKFQPAGSLLHHPEHTYANPGLYSVTLLVRNAGGFNGTSRQRYVRVTEPGMVGVFRPSSQTFYLNTSPAILEMSWGESTDMPVAGDWNGDGLDDVGVHRAALQKFVLKNGTDKTIVKWGLTADTGVSGDWNGDGMGDIGVFRSSLRKFILKNGTEKTVVKWGLSTDLPVAGDWNRDGLWDVGVYRPADRQFILKNGTEKTILSWGLSTDIPVSGDWTGDGYWDVGVFRPSSQKFILKNGTEMTKIPAGESTDLPVAGRWV